LLLNVTYEPLRTISWERAIILMLLNKVEVVETYAQQVRSVRFSYLVPAVVRLVKYARQPRHDVRFTRQNIYLRDQYQCQYCGKKLQSEQLTYDHVIPRSRGGKTNWQNIVTCCHPCNKRKGGKTPEQAGLKLLRPPARPQNHVFFLLGAHSAQIPHCWLIYLPAAEPAQAAKVHSHAH
jgi:5-methylcytosine-specific restriction endonuclease McrA